MGISSPNLVGPLSECSRSVIFERALRGAIVHLTRIRGGNSQKVGKVEATHDSGVIELEPGEEFLEGDLVTVSQEFKGEISDDFSVPIPVQKSSPFFNPPYISKLYECSYGFHLGAMRPGTKVEVYRGPETLRESSDMKKFQLLAEVTSIDGTAFVHFEHGVPRIQRKEILSLRQRICPKPQPPAGKSEWIVDTELPKVRSIGYRDGSLIPAPTIKIESLYACSRCIVVENIIPGLSVFMESKGKWWGSLGPSDQKTADLVLPVALEEGSDVTIVHQAADRCEWRFDQNTYVVAPQKLLPKPKLGRIHCHTEPYLHSEGIKRTADVEIEVNYIDDQGQAQTEVSPGAGKDNLVVAPQMYKESTVRIRQGECAMWSDWSDPVTIPAMHEALQKPKIEGELFDCQNSITVSNLKPVSGTLHIISTSNGEIKQVPVTSDVMMVRIAPNLHWGDGKIENKVFARHVLCKEEEKDSDSKTVHRLPDFSPGELEGPIFDGDTEITVRNVTAGTLVEIWDETDKVPLGEGYAPSSEKTNGRVDARFSLSSPLIYGHRINITGSYCDLSGSHSDGLIVEYHPPVLKGCIPPSFQRDSSEIGQTIPLNLTAIGSHFRPGATIIWENIEHTSTYRSKNPPLETSLDTYIDASISKEEKVYNVIVKNDDGKVSESAQVRGKKAPSEDPVTPPTAPPTAPPTILVSASGSGSDTIFRIEGSGFKSETMVRIQGTRVGVNQIGHASGEIISSKTGTFELNVPIPCVSGTVFYFVATDGRPNPNDKTEFLWSNTVPSTCP